MPEKSGGGLPPSGFGPELRRVREGKGMTQRQLGGGAGIHPNTVAKLERGEMEPSWQMVLALSKALCVECSVFVGTTAAEVEEQPAEEPKAKQPPKKGRKT